MLLPPPSSHLLPALIRAVLPTCLDPPFITSPLRPQDPLLDPPLDLPPPLPRPQPQAHHALPHGRLEDPREGRGAETADKPLDSRSLHMYHARRSVTGSPSGRAPPPGSFWEPGSARRASEPPFPDPKIPGREDIGPVKGEDEEHVDRPPADALDDGEGREKGGVVHGEEGGVSEHAGVEFEGEVAEIGGLLGGDADVGELGGGEEDEGGEGAVAAAADGEEAGVDGGGGPGGQQLVEDAAGREGNGSEGWGLKVRGRGS